MCLFQVIPYETYTSKDDDCIKTYDINVILLCIVLWKTYYDVLSWLNRCDSMVVDSCKWRYCVKLGSWAIYRRNSRAIPKEIIGESTHGISGHVYLTAICTYASTCLVPREEYYWINCWIPWLMLVCLFCVSSHMQPWHWIWNINGFLLPQAITYAS